MRLRDCFTHLYNSPVWRDLPAFLRSVLADASREDGGWREAFRRATQTMDLTGEAQARALLGVGAEAGLAEVRQAYRAKALEYHPDKHAGASGAEMEEAEARFREVQAAYDTLSALYKRRGRGRGGGDE